MKVSILIILVLYISSNIVSAFIKNRQKEGGYSEIDLNDPPAEYLQVLSYVKSHFHQECTNNDINSDTQLIKVVKAYSQIVAGKNYKFIFQVSNFASSQLTIKAFLSLPDKQRKRSIQIMNCQ